MKKHKKTKKHPLNAKSRTDENALMRQTISELQVAGRFERIKNQRLANLVMEMQKVNAALSANIAKNSLIDSDGF